MKPYNNEQSDCNFTLEEDEDTDCANPSCNYELFDGYSVYVSDKGKVYCGVVCCCEVEMK